MSTIVAICPYCRAGGVRARGTALGASATCPKCKSSFTIVPEDDLPDWAAKAGADATTFAAPSAVKPKLPPVEETRVTAALPDVTEPSPVLPPEPRPQPRATPAPVFTSSAPMVAADTGVVIALGALILVGPTVLASQLPFGRFIALALAILGVGGGLFGLGSEGRARIFGALATAAHAVAFSVLLFFPAWLNLDPWQASAPDTEVNVLSVPHNGGPAQPAGESVDGTAAAWVLNDVRVSIHGAFVGPVELVGPKDAKRRSTEACLQLSVRVSNVGTERRLDLGGWATGESRAGVRLVDPTGKELRLKTFAPGWAPERDQPAITGLFPGKHADALLIFEPPTAKSGNYLLELLGAPVGADRPVRFRLSASFLGVRP